MQQCFFLCALYVLIFLYSEDREKEKSDHSKSNSAFIQERDQVNISVHIEDCISP